VAGRAALFRAEIASLPDWSDTLVVSHWGFILSLTGNSVMNGEWLRCDPNDRPPEKITWRA
jgi:glucosyl-3-phosphoglycerate phosphatase